MPMDPVQGHAAIRAVFEFFVTPAGHVEWEVRHLAVTGDVVLTERVDRFRMGGKQVELPIAGVFEIRDAKIVAWRDYFDMATWTRQTAGT
jgi:limonene-1,2-epoxide hydrolase